MGNGLDAEGGCMKRISAGPRKARTGMSVKLKITLWFTAFMTIISAICLILILTIDSQVARNQAYRLLSDTVRGNVASLPWMMISVFIKTGSTSYCIIRTRPFCPVRPLPISQWTQSWKTV